MTSLFRSFWMAGYESACHIVRTGERIDMVRATDHDRECDADYRRLRPLGIRTVREGMRWHLIDRPGLGGGYDFSSVRPLAEAAQRRGIQVVWSLCHYDWPDDLDPLAPTFVDRFARYCGAAARFVTAIDGAPPVMAPINEISYVAWAAGVEGSMHPFAHGQGAAIKHQLIRAAIAGIEAIRAVAPDARIVHIDPIAHVVAPRGRPDLVEEAARHQGYVYEAWDMLCGRLAPELGGHPRYLDAIGVNYYARNQWEVEGDALRWVDRPCDDRWRPFDDILADVWARYERPLFVAETSHVGAGRGTWIVELAHQVRRARERGIPLEGVCLYPIVDRPDWDEPDHWHHSGLWDLHPTADGRRRRVLCRPYARAIREAQRIVSASSRDAQSCPAS